VEDSLKHLAVVTAALAAAIFSSALPAHAQIPVPPSSLTLSLATRANPEVVVLDARDTEQGVMSAHMRIPVRPGPFTLVYPKWIPGEHGPTGPLNNISALRMSANGHALEWNRDKIDMYAFHVDVPSGASQLDVDFTVLLNAPGDTMATRNLAIINWNRDLLYQADTNSHDDYVKPSLILPHGWDYANSLPVASRSGDRVDFETVPLNFLQDSPTNIGRYYKHVTLWSGDNTHQFLDMFADAPEDLDVPPNVLAAYKRMTPEALALYGSRHWNVYHSLLTLSDAVGFQGIEHHQSSDDRAPDDFMTNPREQTASGDLLTHEFSHSWNGKYRRPADLFTWNFQEPMQTDLLWVYEGMNQYLGDVLMYRTGIDAPKNFPEHVAETWARLAYEPGRQTTPLIETTTSAPWRYGASGDYSSLRRTAGDFYAEGELIWLDADTIIREGTGGRKSLDDFLHAFTAPVTTGPVTDTYTREDVEQTLHQTYAYDWHGFFQKYVYEIAEQPPTDMIERSGWRLVWNDKPNLYIETQEHLRHQMNRWYDLGMTVGRNTTVLDVRYASPAWKAGLSAHSQILAVNGRELTDGDGDLLTQAVKDAQHGNGKIAMIVRSGNHVGMMTIDYRGGVRNPHLQRIAGRPDMLAKIAAPHAH
jgi:predicted metalloprotease with PDZ domain